LSHIEKARDIVVHEVGDVIPLSHIEKARDIVVHEVGDVRL